MTFDKINRRTHLYMGLALTPWFLLYAVSSIVLNHNSIVNRKEVKPWTKLYDKPYNAGVPINDDSDQWAIGEKILKEQGLEGRYRAFWDDDDNLVINRQKFYSTIRLTYYHKENRLVAEQKPLKWNEMLTQAHFRAGFDHPYFAEIFWAACVDILVFTTIIWIVSGLLLWINLKRFRFWGWVAIGTGMASFIVMVLTF